jgi:hypothetical protein
MRLPFWWRRLTSRITPERRLRIVEGDSLPKRLPWRDIVLARDADEDWCVGMRCPCGCGQTLELLTISRGGASLGPKHQCGWPTKPETLGLATNRVSLALLAARRPSGLVRVVSIAASLLRVDAVFAERSASAAHAQD